MNKIIYHWTAGSNKPNSTDLLHYHFLIDSYGKIYEGVFSVFDNENCNDRVYAAHTGGGNTGAIGIAFCGMFGFDMKNKSTKYPLTQKQCEAGWKLGAELCKKYKIDIKNVQTHYGFGKRNPKTSSSGKIDICYMQPYPQLKPDEIEDFIRNKINWYLLH